MFLVESKADGQLLGFFMFYPGDATLHSGEVRLGYVFAEAAWGHGYATELVWGFVSECRERGVTAELVAGVTEANTASRKVLDKAGFQQSGTHKGSLEYRLRR